MNITSDKIMRNNKFYNDISDILISQNRIFQVPIQNFFNLLPGFQSTIYIMMHIFSTLL